MALGHARDNQKLPHRCYARSGDHGRVSVYFYLSAMGQEAHYVTISCRIVTAQEKEVRQAGTKIEVILDNRGEAGAPAWKPYGF